ncbi:MAG TPA: response regulator [bacterium]|nr:response regulator [bacterium]HQO34485.1 response regulator [bacterium]
MDLAAVRVLITDDSGAMRRILTDMLRRLGIREVDEARDGLEALQRIRTTPYDLVLMDWNMPGMKGIDAVREIRAKGNRVPIIMATTESDKSKVVEALVTGANDYIIKPFTIAVLSTKIQETLNRADVQPMPSVQAESTVSTEDVKIPYDSLKVLVADDSSSMRHILTRFLRGTGIQSLDEVSDGREAVQKVMQGGIDVVFMDWNMPEMNGLEAVKAIREIGEKVPIIMVTQKSDRENVIEALAAGANNFIAKPFSEEIFAKKLRETLKKALQEAAPPETGAK